MNILNEQIMRVKTNMKHHYAPIHLAFFKFFSFSHCGNP